MMETKLVAELNPVYHDIYLSALREQGLRVYAKEFNLDGWIRSEDLFLIYDEAAELDLAREIVSSLETEAASPDEFGMDDESGES